MKKWMIVLGLVFTFSASASEVPSAPATNSRALQAARRVASMENGNDLPSRAFRLGQRAAKNSKLAYEVKTSKRGQKKATTQN